VDRSLWLLIGLRFRAALRRWGRGVRTLKGFLLALVGSLLFLPMIFGLVVSVVMRPFQASATHLDAVREYGPLVLLGVCLANLFLTSGDAALAYSPAEVNFLFSAPFRPRQVLLYKLASGLLASVFTSVVLGLAFSQHASVLGAACLGAFLALQLIFLIPLAVGLLISTFGALMVRRGRRVLAAAIVLAVAASAWPLAEGAPALTPALAGRVLRSPALGVLLAPLRPFVTVFTAERVWPDLVGGVAGALGVDLALLAAVIGLNAGLLEASAAASQRVYERLRRQKRGGISAGRIVRFHPESGRGTLPMPPRWGGVGPNVWRHLTTLSRSPLRLLPILVFVVGYPLGLFFLTRRAGPPGFEGVPAIVLLSSVLLFVGSTTLGFDFRADLGRLEDLKALPLRPGGVALGEILTPVLVLTAGEWLTLAVIAGLSPPPTRAVAAAAAALAPPLNVMIVTLENLYFLWFPHAVTTGAGFDVQALGRMMLMSAAKSLVLGLAVAVAAGLGALVYLATGGHRGLTVATAWLVVTGFAVSLLPLLALAFERLDVAETRAE
jgi:hypothetical protein